MSLPIPIPTSIPQEIIDEILDHLAPDAKSLQRCALVSKSWVPSCRRHFFHTVFFNPQRIVRWLELFPVPEESPARYVRQLRLLVGKDDSGCERFLEHSPWFTNVEGLTLTGHEYLQPLWMPSLPQSVTSLVISADTIALAQVRDVLAQLPNLDDFSLSGPLVTTDRRTLPRTGTAPRGRFGGKFKLIEGHTSGVVDMLLEIPTGLHFTEVDILGTRECLPPTVRLAEACSKTLLKLSFAQYGREASERSFDFSKFANLREVHFRVSWRNGRLFWISAALSTLRPTTSPRLSVIRLCLLRPPAHSNDTTIEHIGNDFRRVADEITRIKREFEGAVNVAVYRDTWFNSLFVVLDILPR